MIKNIIIALLAILLLSVWYRYETKKIMYIACERRYDNLMQGKNIKRVIRDEETTCYSLRPVYVPISCPKDYNGF